MTKNRILCRVASVGFEMEPGQNVLEDDGDPSRYRVRLVTASSDDPEGADVSIVVGEDELVAFPLGGRVHVTVEPLDEANPIEQEKVKFRRTRDEADEAERERVESAYKAWRETGMPLPSPSGVSIADMLRDPKNERLMLSAFYLAEEIAGGRPIG